MDPLDPRHGTYAGYHQHLRDGERPYDICMPCHEAMRRYQRVRPHLHAIGRPPRVPLGARAYANIRALKDAGFTHRQLEDATGSAASSVNKYLREGPTTRVLRRVRARLETIDPHVHIAARLTHEGTIRRAQALGRIGYSAAKLGPIADMHPDAVALLQRGEAVASSDTTRRKIAAAYQILHMRPLDPTHDRHVSKTINRAKAAGWAAPFAWDSDIDDPHARPKLGRNRRRAKHEIDEANVLRLLQLERVPCTTAERHEAMRRWKAAGKPARQLALAHGWHDGRYSEEVSA